MDATQYFLQVSRPYYSLPPESGASDDALLTLCQRLNFSSPKALLDYGCGQGRLLAALKASKPPTDLSKLHYVGVDSDPDSLTVCRDYFRTMLEPAGARGCFLPPHVSGCTAFIADYITLVFTVHELDPLNLDHTLAVLWRQLRRGGTLLIQDTEVPFHKEIEFISFTPEQLRSLLKPLQADLTHDVVRAGRSSLPVYILEATKPLSQP